MDKVFGHESCINEIVWHYAPVDDVWDIPIINPLALDIAEGADMVIAKPDLPNLDIICRAKQTFGMPTFTYQVSGEYVMLKVTAQNDWQNECAAVMEVLTCFKRAGCDGTLTYYAGTGDGVVGGVSALSL